MEAGIPDVRDKVAVALLLVIVTIESFNKRHSKVH